MRKKIHAYFFFYINQIKKMDGRTKDIWSRNLLGSKMQRIRDAFAFSVFNFRKIKDCIRDQVVYVILLPSLTIIKLIPSKQSKANQIKLNWIELKSEKIMFPILIEQFQIQMWNYFRFFFLFLLRNSICLCFRCATDYYLNIN